MALAERLAVRLVRTRARDALRVRHLGAARADLEFGAFLGGGAASILR